MRRVLPLLLFLLALPAAADVGYAPPPGGCVTRAGTAHGGKPHPVVVLPRETVWTQETLKAAFGPYWSAGVPGPHSTDYISHMQEAFRTRTARWLSGPADPAYLANDGAVSVWEGLYAYYCADRRAAPVGSGPIVPPPPPPLPPRPPPPPPPLPVDLCPTGQACRPPCPACPVCPAGPTKFTVELLPNGGVRVTPVPQ